MLNIDNCLRSSALLAYHQIYRTRAVIGGALFFSFLISLINTITANIHKYTSAISY